MWEVPGSIPGFSMRWPEEATKLPFFKRRRVVISTKYRGEKGLKVQLFFHRIGTWGISSDGRALALHVRGTGIDARILHNFDLYVFKKTFWWPLSCSAVYICSVRSKGVYTCLHFPTKARKNLLWVFPEFLQNSWVKHFQMGVKLSAVFTACLSTGCFWLKTGMTLTWFEHAAFWSGVRRATVAPQSLPQPCTKQEPS